MGICRFLLSKKEEVSLFDNGLRIESNLKILCNDKWQYRYVVCQRRCLSEAPLIGIFKNGRARERNEHLELFYLQNYIGYEYGFKYKGSNKTLALLVQGQTLIFSFSNVESMVFWKEWLKDVCGRSAMFFVRVYSAPKDSSVIKFSSRNARIHITRYALVIVQEVPPKQRLYLNLEDLSDVECVQNKFAFRALTYPWNHPQTFIFTSDQIPELTAKLQCLLKSKQYFGQSVQVSRLSSLKNSSLGQTSNSHAHQFFTHSPGVYANDGQSPETPLFCSLYANENDEIHRSSSQESSENGEGPPPLKKKSFEEGPYAIPVDLGGDPTMDFDGNIHSGPVRSHGGSHNHDEIDDFHFVEGMPAHFLNQQLSPAEQMNPLGMNTPPPGLVKPISSLDFLSAGSKLRKSLSKKLKRHLAGSYSKYDGDKSSTSYPKEAGSGSQRRIRPKKSVTPVKELMNSTKLLAQPIIEESLSSAAQSPSIVRPAKAKATRNESFDSSISSTVRIDSAVRKGRERLKMSRRSSTSASQRNSTVNSEKSSTNDLTVVEKEEENEGMEVDREEELQNAEEEGTVKGKQSASDSKSISHSISTLQTNSQKSAAGEDFDRSGSVATTVHNLETPLAISLDELLDPEFKIKAPSAISLKEKSPSLSSEKSSNGSQRSLSVCSELNSRVMFQRGGRNRASGRSNKITEVPLPPTLPPPPLPPRKISSQISMPKQLTRPIIKTNDDYADIDDAIFDEWTTFGHQDSNQIYANQPAPSFARKENIDYVQICPIATSALKELSSARGTAFKRSNSLYDILAIQSKNASKKQQQQSSEAEYYSSFDWSPMAMGPRAFTSSTSYLTHMLSQARENLQKGAGSRNASSSNLPNLK